MAPCLAGFSFSFLVYTDFARSVFAPHALLDDATCELLASVGPIESLEMLQQLLEPGWSHWEEFGKRLYVYLHGLVIPPLPHLRRAKTKHQQPLLLRLRYRHQRLTQHHSRHFRTSGSTKACCRPYSHSSLPFISNVPSSPSLASHSRAKQCRPIHASPAPNFDVWATATPAVSAEHADAQYAGLRPPATYPAPYPPYNYSYPPYYYQPHPGMQFASLQTTNTPSSTSYYYPYSLPPPSNSLDGAWIRDTIADVTQCDTVTLHAKSSAVVLAFPPEFHPRYLTLKKENFVVLFGKQDPNAVVVVDRGKEDVAESHVL
ncbi:hypothetical protein B0H10DRAFT_2438445 [Mycena sp. CBHHK59/15]|nr:hypothetical protein B0H10DRAFT_2438445 [Mycena sp. CBHHK59/15]